MESVLFAIAVAAMCLTGAWIGHVLRLRLPKEHLNAETSDLVKLSMAFLSTLISIVLGLVVASARGSFDQRADEVQAMAAKMVQLDAQLRRLGDVATPVRAQIHQYMSGRVDAIWGRHGEPLVGSRSQVERLEHAMLTLPVASESQKASLSNAMRLLDELNQIRSVAQVQARSPVLFPLVILIGCWLSLFAAGLGLLASRNRTVLVIDALLALVSASAIFVILELERGFGGFIQVSDAPVHAALSEMKR